MPSMQEIAPLETEGCVGTQRRQLKIRRRPSDWVGTVLASLETALSTAFQPSLGEADSADLDADLGGDNAAHFVCSRGHIHRPHSKPFHMAPMGSIPRLFRASWP
jgi:hypothetical protein